MSVTYLVTGLIGGALLTKIWEDAVWSGFVQQRLMDRHARRALRAPPADKLIPYRRTFCR
jgi:hypothetical protein